jgi:hypothetical protein
LSLLKQAWQVVPRSVKSDTWCFVLVHALLEFCLPLKGKGAP